MTTPPRDDRKLERNAQQARTVGLYTAIPTMMIVGPVLGWLAGHWAGGRWGHAETFEAVGAVFGLVAAFRQVAVVVRRTSELQERDRS